MRQRTVSTAFSVTFGSFSWSGAPSNGTTADVGEEAREFRAGLGGAIASVITDTARNPIGIAPFTGTFSDPATPAELQAFAA